MRTGAALLAALLWAASARAATVTLLAYDDQGKPLDAAALTERISRADGRGPLALWGWTPDGLAGLRPTLKQRGEKVALSWPKLPRLVLSLPWPVPDDGFSTVLVDRDGRGMADGDEIRLNEEIALTQYRLFKEASLKHAKDMDPQYEPSAKSRKLADAARDSIAKAEAASDPGERAKLFGRALHDVSAAWQKMLVEHGEQLAANGKAGATLRFGLTLDSNMVNRLDHYEWIIDTVHRSGANWVRLVFRPNPSDFLYSQQSSFNEYDGIVKALRARNLRVMGCALDTGQWPSTLTASLYAQRLRNLVLHFKGQINSWEIGSEVNGDWLGGRRSPLPVEEVVRIFSAGAAAVKDIEPALETVLTLYWWEGTAPDEAHSLFGWLKAHSRRSFVKDVDVVALSLQIDENPVGLALERVFDRVHQAFPDKRLMLGSFGYVEADELKGYWWLDPKDIDGARKDLVTLLTAGACALPGSVGGGFWWQTLDQMLPAKHKATDLYRVYKRAIGKLR